MQHQIRRIRWDVLEAAAAQRAVLACLLGELACELLRACRRAFGDEHRCRTLLEQGRKDAACRAAGAEHEDVRPRERDAVHLHMIFVDGAYRSDGAAPPVFHPVPPPATADLQALVQRIAERLGRLLERRGLIERDAENAWLSGDSGEVGALDDLIGHSITYRIAVGPRAGQKVFTLQSVAAPPERAGRHGAAEASGFSLHAGLEIQPGERAKLERLCRYVSRPPVATERLALTPSGQVRYQLKTPYRDGTTHIVLEPLDLMSRLAALVPPPRMHLTRYHGVFAPHSRLRAAITPAGRGAGGKGAKQAAEAPAVPKRVAMSWAQRLKRVFAIEIDTCARCQGRLRVIASIEEPVVIARILAHRERDGGAAEPELAPIVARAPPRQGRLL